MKKIITAKLGLISNILTFSFIYFSTFILKVQAASPSPITAPSCGQKRASIILKTQIDDCTAFVTWTETNGTKHAGYLNLFIQKIMPIVILAAIVMIIASGVQYMLSGGNAEQAKQSKTRIVGIIGGLIFYVMMKYIIMMISTGISL